MLSTKTLNDFFLANAPIETLELDPIFGEEEPEEDEEEKEPLENDEDA